MSLVRRTIVPALISLVVAASRVGAVNTVGAGKNRPGGTVHRSYEKATAMTGSERAMARLTAMTRGGNASRAPHATATGYIDTVDGRRNPERFFRYELFDELLMALCPENVHREAAKRDWGPALRSVGVDDTSFWTTLEHSAGSYRSAHCVRRGVTVPDHGTTRVKIKTVRDSAEVQVDVDLVRCRRRAAAFEAAQRAIGKGTLDRVLYGVVAPATLIGLVARPQVQHRLPHSAIRQTALPKCLRTDISTLRAQV